MFDPFAHYLLSSWILVWCFTELSLISLHWFLTAFASVVHMKVLLRIWDLFFYEGSTVLFQVTLGMLKMKVPVICFLYLEYSFEYDCLACSPLCCKKRTTKWEIGLFFLMFVTMTQVPCFYFMRWSICFPQRFLFFTTFCKSMLFGILDEVQYYLP